MPRPCIPSYTVIRDTREKPGQGWTFDPHRIDHRPPRCAGTIVETLGTGDYTVRGYEDLVVIERKFDFSELWGNYGERERFEAEMERMTKIRHRFILIETTLTHEAMALSPPQFRTAVPGKAMVAWLTDLSLQYDVHIMCVGQCGKRIAQQIFESVVRREKTRWAPKDEGTVVF